ncbi:hypothetical protein [Oharaeibacter diazotrophicus]|uniref:DUF4148 domain-containing protein n=1 Tax=Oharaeibacter diazotrophicus TaxID=1920512 RepID=A0A4R6RFY5_9HYPH|nr:hypothetical protein [Oharaeibacter diazotrophicus]TDP85172.1 hypothetical protein EDD54_2020 [Oharaeibacter diazotrophicus]BBE74142.1 hypothetical protein OHA_1_03770 [Pleomorphomonas sp. SM30]GLS76170.1 hypothetical protein GCM10007904_15050 [Oharaeibacter diazotrophicus]
MTTKLVTLSAAALIALTSVASAAGGVDFANSAQDAAQRANAFTVAPSANGYVTTPAIDLALSQQDANEIVRSQAVPVVTTHGAIPVQKAPAIDFALGDQIR